MSRSEKFHKCISSNRAYLRDLRMSPAGLDDLDRRILGILQRDSRTSFAEMSRKLKVTEATVRFRIKRLLNKGVVLKFAALLDPEKAGFPVSGAILLKIDPEHLEETSAQLTAFVQTMFLFQSTGEYDMVAVVYSHDMTQLTQLVRKIKMIPGVKEARVSVTTRFLKFDPTFQM